MHALCVCVYGACVVCAVCTTGQGQVHALRVCVCGACVVRAACTLQPSYNMLLTHVWCVWCAYVVHVV